ncbi:unnamed protein product [Rotaria socialis]
MVETSLQQIKQTRTRSLFLVAILTGILLFSAYIIGKNHCVNAGVPFVRYNKVAQSRESAVSSDCSVDSKWIYHMHQWTDRSGPYSQGSQDLYLEKIFSVFHTTNRYFVEFGFNTLSYGLNASGANTQKLYEDGWRGLLLDANNENTRINLKKHYLFATNIVAIFEENNVPKEFDYLSCDMDSHDLWVFRAILEAGYRPRVITTEYNSNYPITDAITLLDPTIVRNSVDIDKFEFKFSQCAWGAGAGALRIVAEAHGYKMVGRVGNLDLIWMRNDLLMNQCSLLPPFEWFFHDASIGKLHHRQQSSSDILSQIIDYETYVRTGGNLTASNRAAHSILKRRRLPCYESVKNFF